MSQPTRSLPKQRDSLSSNGRTFVPKDRARSSSTPENPLIHHRRSTSLALDVHDNEPLTPPSEEDRPDTPLPSLMADHSSDSPSERLRSFYERNKGLAYVLLAQIFGCLMNVTTRLLEIEGNHGSGMHPFQILFVRMTITTILSTLYMWWSSIPHFPLGLKEVRWLLLARGMGGFFGVFGMYYSLLYLPLADATVITFISPSLSCFACSILLKEPFTRMEQVGALISFIGVTLIARPSTFFQHAMKAHVSARDEPPVAPQSPPEEKMGVADLNQVTSTQRLSAVCVALVGVLGSAMAFTAMRWIGKRAHPLLSVNYFCAMCTVVSATAMAVLPGVKFLLPATGREWSYLIFLGICGFAMQFLLSAGLQHEKSSRATNMVYTQMLFALIFDKVVFGTNPTLLSLLGSSMILGSAIYVALQKESIKQRQEEDKVRQQAARSSGMDVELSRTRTRSLGGQDGASRDEERGLIDDTDDGPKDAEKPVR